MLQSIRDRTQGWIAGIIISLVILSFALWGIHSYIAGMAENPPIAKVNGEEITKKEFVTTYERLRRQVQANLKITAVPEQLDAEIKQRTRDALINLEVLKQASIAENYEISPAQIFSYIKGIPAFQIDGRFSNARFQQILSSSAFSQEEFLNVAKANLLIDQPKLGIVLSSFALPNEVAIAGALTNQERDVEIITVPQFDFIKQVTVSDKEVGDYYDQHKDLFKAPEQVSVDYIELSMKDLIANTHPTEQAMKKFYQDNLNSYLTEKQWKLEKILIPLSAAANAEQVAEAQKKATHILMEITKGGEYSSFVRQYPSEDKLPQWVTLTQVSKELENAVKGLTSPGQVSEPVRVKNGLMIIKAIEIKQPQTQPYEQVKNHIQEMLSRQLAEEKFVELRDKLNNVAYEYPDSLQPASKAVNLPIKTSALFSRDKDAGDVITKDKKVRDIAFSDDVINLKNNSDVIQVDQDTVIVLRVKSHILASFVPRSAIERQIIEYLKSEKANAMSAKLANEIKNKLQSNALTPDQVAQQYHYSWNNLGYVSRTSTKVDSAVVTAVFQLAQPAKGKLVYGVVKTPLGYAVIGVKDIREGKSSNKTLTEVETNEGLLEYKLYELGLMKKAKIT